MASPDRFLSSTRGKILQSLLRSQATVTDLADRFGLTDAGARHHVRALVRDGYVEEYADRITGARPAAVYRATDEALALFPNGCESLLAAVLRGYEADWIEIADFLANVGHLVAEENELPMEAMTDERVEHAIRLFEDFGGIIDRIDLPNESVRLDGLVCPFNAVAGGQPGICRLAAVMLERLTYVPVEALCDRSNARRPRCRLLLRIALDAPRNSATPTPASP